MGGVGIKGDNSNFYIKKVKRAGNNEANERRTERTGLRFAWVFRVGTTAHSGTKENLVELHHRISISNLFFLFLLDFKFFSSIKILREWPPFPNLVCCRNWLRLWMEWDGSKFLLCNSSLIYGTHF